ncbi:hypothetical protein CDEST_12049 [Colletotrichum destructivum]|uniref:Zn(2)-C6 fungal-type domain-containing protein n=1 Tax=Colletotrichum destructivum TaxID=34406 RepID=A0AAX4IUX1_9PEZI|nr:hypothetical protein CDEST_12049 [Colletotrichum destructivum]
MASREHESRRSNVRRTNVTACTRCRSRKQRCDQNIPACSNCERAGAPCVSTDIDGQVAPRSYIKSLEDRVAYLETQLASREAMNLESASADFAPSPLSWNCSSRDPIEQVFYQSLEGGVFFNSITTPNGQSLLRSLLAEPLRSVSQTPKQSDHRSLLDELPGETRAALPSRDATGRLIEAYFEHCEFFSPILPSKDDFLAAAALLYDYDDGGGDDGLAPQNTNTNNTAGTTLARFRTYTVFATAVLLLNRTDPAFPVSRAEGYFATATRLLALHPAVICTGDLHHLCNLLLVAQHCCFASNLGGAWHFLGLASRLAIELGLHDERRPIAAKPGPEQLDQRRWLFWALYTMERNLCVIIGRPFSIPDEAIHTPLPDLAAGDGDGGGGGGSRALALHLIKHRRLESEIYVTLNQKPPQNGAAVDLFAWREDMRRRVTEWHGSAPAPTAPSTQLAPSDIFKSIMHHHMVLLYYPSACFPDPSADEIRLLARSAAACVGNYRRAFRDGQLRFFWRTTHNLFRSGVAVAYCLHLLRAAPVRRPDLDRGDMVASVNVCMSVLWAMVERYPPGAVYRDAFESLANSVLRSDGDGGGGDTGQIQEPGTSFLAYDPSMLASIDLPQTSLDALYWGFGNLA